VNPEQQIREIISKVLDVFVTKKSTTCLYKPPKCDGVCDDCITEAILATLSQPTETEREKALRDKMFDDLRAKGFGFEVPKEHLTPKLIWGWLMEHMEITRA